MRLCALFLSLYVCCITYVIVIKECRSSERDEEHSRTTVHSERRFTEERPSAINAPQIDSVEHGDDDDKNYLDIEELKRKLEETESAMTKIIARMSRIVPKSQVSLLLLFPSSL